MSWRKLVLWLVLSVFYLLIFESMVRLFWPQNKTTEHLAGESLGEKDPVLGHRLRANAHSRTHTAEFTVDYQTNADGWRDARLFSKRSTVEHSPTEQASARRLLILGDSFTFGEGVAYESIFPVRLESSWEAAGQAVEVVKAGVPGYDTRREVLLLEKLLERYQPDAVLIVWVPNDLFTNVPIADHKEKARADGEEAGDVITVRQEKKQRPNLHSVSLLRRLALGQDALYVHLYAKIGRGRFFAAELDAEVEEKLRVTADLLRRAQVLCAEQDVDLAVASLPQQFQVLLAGRGGDFPEIDVHALDRRLGALAEKAGFAWWPLLDDLARVYATSGDALYYRLDGHLNASGHGAMAEILERRFAAWPAWHRTAEVGGEW